MPKPVETFAVLFSKCSSSDAMIATQKMKASAEVVWVDSKLLIV